MDLTKAAKEIFLKAVDEVKPENIINKDLLFKEPFYLFGSGKASIECARAVEKIALDRIKSGFVVCNYSSALQKSDVFESSHPIPSQKSLKASDEMIKRISSLKKEDKFIYLLSGGSSALLEKPIPPISLREFQNLTSLLLLRGADIYEINSVRKHLSSVKGGRVAKLCKAKGRVLVISDVLGDSLEVIGSAPFYFDKSTFKDVYEILRDYDIWDEISDSIREIVLKGLRGEVEETLKESLKNIEHIIIANNKKALNAAKREAFKMGFEANVLDKPIEMDVKDAALFLLKKARSENRSLIFGGECTVEVKGSGKGGRNQELCLRVLKLMKKDDDFVFLSGGSDGIDGNSDAAGAVVSFDLKKRVGEEVIDKYLENNDSNGFFERFGGVLKTSYTGTNVADIGIILKEKRWETFSKTAL